MEKKEPFNKKGVYELEIKQLTYNELQQFMQFKSKVTVDRAYEVVDDQLIRTLTSECMPVTDFEQRLLLLQDIHLHGGYIIGAFMSDELIGLAALDSQYISGFRLRLAELVVKNKNRQVAQQLLARTIKQAKQLEAEALYICANASQEEIDFYLEQGAQLAKRADSYLSQLYEVELHLEIIL